jgi:hypothetical protein
VTRCGRLLIKAAAEDTIVGEEVTEKSDMARGEKKMMYVVIALRYHKIARKELNN